MYVHFTCVPRSHLQLLFNWFKGLIEKDEAYRIVKNYSAVYPGVLSVDVLLFKDFCEKCTILDEGKPLIHTNDVIKYLRDCS